jgi:hypothetical protein
LAALEDDESPFSPKQEGKCTIIEGEFKHPSPKCFKISFSVHQLDLGVWFLKPALEYEQERDREKTQLCCTGKVPAKSKMTQKKNRLRNNKERRGRMGNEERERQQLAKSHGGEIRRNGNYWVFAGYGYFQIHAWRERALAGVDLACLDSHIFFFLLDNFHGLVVKD